MNRPLTKIFDSIRASGGSVFLAKCTCQDDACTCHDLTTGEPLTAKANKDSSMPTQTKFSNETLAAIQASAPSLPLHDLKVLNAALAVELRARESQNSKKAIRLKKLQAAMAAQAGDPLTDSKVGTCRSELRRLGLGEINAHGENGVDLHDLDQRMKAEKWDAARRISLKAALSDIGLLED
jgi:hypothetical protein